MRKFLYLMFVLSATTAWAAEDCRLEHVAALPLQLEKSNQVSVPVSFGERALRLIVDTGSPASVLTEGAVARLAVRPQPVQAPIRFTLFGGERMKSFVKLDDFRLGALHVDHTSFLVMSDSLPAGVDGLIGADFLRQFDVDFDFANARMNLFRPHRCAGRAVYWTKDDAAIATVPFEATSEDRHIVFPVALDGQTIEATLDTGASMSTMNLESAQRLFGIDAQASDVRMLGKNASTYPFKTLAFGGVTVANPAIVMLPEAETQFPNYKMLLGMTVLRQLHLFIAYREKTLYVTSADAR